MRPVIVLSLICLVAASLLAAVNQLTIKPIAEAKNNLKVEALAEIFPFKIKDAKPLTENDAVYYEVFNDNGELGGVGIETYTNLGYGGRIDVLLGVSTEGKIFDYKVVSSFETPGLGSKLSNTEFREQFKGKSLGTDFKWKVKKDGGDVDEITAATISSRAIIDAISKGLDLYSKRYNK
jgi:electron transport complex protein RnfG